jgi:hypothetical protein
MPENKADTPKCKYLVWSDGDEVKVMDMGIDYHTNVKTQVIVKQASYRQVKNASNGAVL